MKELTEYEVNKLLTQTYEDQLLEYQSNIPTETIDLPLSNDDWERFIMEQKYFLEYILNRANDTTSPYNTN